MTALAPAPAVLPGGTATSLRAARLRLSGVYLASRIVVLVVMAVAAGHDHKPLTALLKAWDGSWYMYIAAHGYPAHPIDMTPYLWVGAGYLWAIAFLPGYPALISALGFFGVPLLAAGLAISLLSGWAATLLVHALGLNWTGGRQAEGGAAFFCLFPGAFVFSWVYTEGLAIALAMACLLLLLRSRWVWAGLSASLAGCVHSDMAIALFVAAAVAAAGPVVRDRDWRPLAAPALAPVGLVAYFGYLQVHTGSWRNWQTAQRLGWYQYIDFGRHEISALQQSVFDLVVAPSTAQRYAIVVVAGFVATAVGVFSLVHSRLPAPALAYSLTILCICFSSTAVGLRPRGLLEMAPMFPALAAMGGLKLTRAFMVVSLILTPLLVWAYLTPPMLVP